MTGFRILAILTLLAVLLVTAACAEHITPGPTMTATPQKPTATPARATLKATATSVSTHTPVPVFVLSPTGTPVPVVVPSPTGTPAPSPTATLTPTHTPVPIAALLPTDIPRLPTGDSESDVVTVCAAGCDFATIQAAIDDAIVTTGRIIQVMDAVHTEAGIVVDNHVTIRGQGAERTIVQAHREAGQATDRVFFIAKGAAVAIEDLTIRHGSPIKDRRSGGGVLNRGTLVLLRCVVSDNLANCGGGILNDGGGLTITDSSIRDNTADGQAPQGYNCGSGGAIKNVEGGSLTLVNSTLDGNYAEGKGGGLHVSCKSSAILINSTISDNYAVGRGGGIHFKGKVTLVHCTISSNGARGIVRGNGIGAEPGGGLSVRGPLYLANTLIADNLKGGDCVLSDKGALEINVHSLVGDNSCAPAYSGDPGLAPLADNGGYTLTCALFPGSPAIDAIPASDCPLATDQRGELRPVGQTSGATFCDIGAFEGQ